MPSRTRSWMILGTLLLVLGVSFVVPHGVQAQTLSETTGLSEFASAAGFGGTSDLRLVIARLIRTAISLAGIVLIGMVIYAGFQWMTAGGAQDKIEKARATLFRAVVGLIIIFASFALTQFVLSSLLQATGASGSLTDGVGGTGGGGSCATCPVDTRRTFVTETWGCLEEMTLLPKNAEIQIAFNHEVSTDKEYLGEQVQLFAGSRPVDALVSGRGRIVTVAPADTTCEVEAGAYLCPGTTYRVVVQEGFESQSGLTVECTVTHPCSHTFTTTDEVDEQGPVIHVISPSEGSPVFSFVPLDLQAQVSDNGGIGVTTFTVNGNWVASGAPMSCEDEGGLTCFANGVWTPGNLSPGSAHVIRATATDCSGNTGVSEPVTVEALALHCANGVQDSEETGLDCGGPDCLSCAGGSCRVGSECASGRCEEGVCVVGPQIRSVSPRGDSKDDPALRGVPNGAPGNLITIQGVGFGDRSGSVVFLGNPNDTSDDVLARIAVCPETQWTDTEITVLVPEGVPTGPLQVIADSGLEDRTDAGGGNWVPDFVANEIVRPGLCGVIPNFGQPGDRVGFSGLNFGSDASIGRVYFDGSSVYRATFLPSLDTWSDTALSLLVPPSTAGSYDVSVFVDGEGSNTVQFQVEESDEVASGSPQIDRVDSGVQVCQGDVTSAGVLCSSDDACGSGTCEASPNVGGEGQYVTIFGRGFGTAVGTVVFSDEDVGDVVAIPEFPAQCSDRWWSDTVIVTQVPEGFSTSATFNPKTIRVRSASYPRVEQSNGVPFTVTDLGTTPGICAITPTAGPIGTPVTLYGSGLGTTAADVDILFSSQTSTVPSVVGDAGTETHASNREIGVNVPSGSGTGPVVAVVEGVVSNQLSFEVGNCNATPSMCSSSQVCCSSGVCAENLSACTGQEVAAQYVYHFTTGPIPNVPTVIEACNGQTMSPSPSTLWSDGRAACVNANIMVAFQPGNPARAMNISRLTSPQNVYLEQCNGAGIDPCESVLTDANNVPVHLAGSLSATALTVTLNPTANLLQDTWYQVTVSGNVANEHNVRLGEDYVFRFKTRADAAECVVEDVLVSPADYTAVTSDPVSYEALPTNGTCQTLDPSSYTYDWNLTNYGLDILLENLRTRAAGVTNRIQVIPNQETNAGQPALVNASVVGYVAEDTEELTVDFLQPSVSEAYPLCESACTNAQIGAVFTTTMTSSGTYGLTGSHGTGGAVEANVRLFKCTDELCDTFVSGGPLTAPVVMIDDPLDPQDGRAFFLNASLDPSSYYRVMIWGGVESRPGAGQTRGVPLYGDVTPQGNPVEPLNYGSYYSWMFKTRADASACGLGSVSLEPSQLILQAIGDRGALSAQAFGYPDACSSRGQRLNPLSYPWEWLLSTIANPMNPSVRAQIASFLPDHGLRATLDTRMGSSFSTCTASCLNAGSRAYAAVCGNGRVDPGEDCDPTAPGSSSAECSSSCLTVGVTACTSTVTSLCCGNGIREGREECDDGGNENGNGCSASCLNEGSTKAGLTCGDGQIVHRDGLFADPAHEGRAGGEECDDGNTASGDGCSSLCLNEGSVNTLTIGGVVCGDGAIGAGEDCDDGNHVSGDGCSSSCLQEPLKENWVGGGRSGICGNGVLEAGGAGTSGVGEECDDGNRVSGDGCSSGCLVEGASLFYANPSFCGDGVLSYSPISGGEECEVTSADTTPAYDSVQYVEIEPVAAQTVVDGFTRTTVQTTGRDTATSASPTASGSVGLSCSCTTDATCGSTEAIGCGLNGCCFARPTVDETATVPLLTSGGPVCRNTLARVVFSEQMLPDSLFADAEGTDPNVFLELVAQAGEWEDKNGDGVYTDGTTDVLPVGTVCPESYFTFDAGAGSGFGRFFRRMVRVVYPRAWAAESVCVMPAELVPVVVNAGTSSLPDLKTQVQVAYREALEPGAVYRLVVVADADPEDGIAEGVLSAWNVSINGKQGLHAGPAAGHDGTWSRFFTTGTEICQVDEVIVTDTSASAGLFTVSGETHSLQAEPVHYSGTLPETLAEVPGLYEWEWSWLSPVTTPDVLVLSGAVQDSQNMTVTTASPAVNGEETIQARLQVASGVSTSLDVPGRVVLGGVAERVFLCQNPWPSVQNFPFADTEAFASGNTLVPTTHWDRPYTNFSMFYCRDAGDPNSFTDDLPALSIVAKTDTGNAIQEPGVFKEFLFSVNDGVTHDAIGVRILSNETYQTPSEWFADRGFVGTPQQTTLDGFAAVRDGRTLYATAPNIAAAPSPLSGEALYPNVYVVAYSEGASDVTREIYKRLTESWSFLVNEDTVTGALQVTNDRVCVAALSAGADPVLRNGEPVSCTSDLECGVLSVLESGLPVSVYCEADKDKLRRDYQRIVDVRNVGISLEAYGNSHRHCSVTKAQSCVVDSDCSGTETCEAGVPLISSGSYIPGMSTSTWPSWQAQLGNRLGTAVPTDPLNAYQNCPDGSDSVTCYNELQAIAQCPAGSQVYTYRAVGDESYLFQVELESGEHGLGLQWAYPVDTFDLGTIELGNATPPTADYATGGTGGFESARVCQSSVTFAAANQCGDGLVGAGELCEVGQTRTESCEVSVCVNTTNLSYNGQVCTSSSTCGPGGSCLRTMGVKTVACLAPGEPASTPGPGCNRYQTVAESSAACVPYFCGDGIRDANGPDDVFGTADDELCDDGPLNGQYGYCGLSCTYVGAAFCGDGRLGGTEVCDCGWNASTNSSADPARCRDGATALLNGVYSLHAAQGCSSTCSGPAAYCGDLVVNGGEQCDGGVDSWGGALCSDGKPCTTNSDCGSGTCGAGASACPVTATGITQVRTRVCQGTSAGPSACTWPTGTGTPGGWGACTPTGSCGNGVKEGTEACDDGNTNNQDACLNTCELNVCGDGFRNVGTESCDLGAENGVACTAPYGGTCTYCSSSCTFLAQTGGFCGDNVINGGEYCDGTAIPKRCFKANVDPSLRQVGPECQVNTDGTNTCPAGEGYTDCVSTVGYCNGGSTTSYDYNGFPCTDRQASDKACGFGPGSQPGVCVLQDCDRSCSQSCPVTLEEGVVQVQPEGSSTRAGEVSLFSYLADLLNPPSPDEATLFFPACRVGTQLVGDVSFANVVPPRVDVLFVVDLSGSMNKDVNGHTPAPGVPSRAEIAREGLSRAVETLFEGLPQQNSLAIGMTGFGLVTSPPATERNGYVPINAQSGADQNTAGTLLPFSTIEQDVRSAMETQIIIDGNTPTADGLDWAYHVLAERRATDPGRQQIVVLLSDGAPSEYDTTASRETGGWLHAAAPGGGTYSSIPVSSGTSSTRAIRDAYNVSQALQNVGVKVYTAAFTTGSNITKNNHLSSNECDATTFTDTSDCVVGSDGVDYAYDAQTAEEFTEMMSAIVNNILGLNVGYVTSTGSEGGAVREGTNVVLPFPPGFSCELSPSGTPTIFTIPFFTTFQSGDPLSSKVRISNLRLRYCPFE